MVKFVGLNEILYRIAIEMPEKHAHITIDKRLDLTVFMYFSFRNESHLFDSQSTKYVLFRWNKKIGFHKMGKNVCIFIKTHSGLNFVGHGYKNSFPIHIYKMTGHLLQDQFFAK